MVKIIDKEFVPFITAEAIDSRLQEMGEMISKDFKDDNPIILGVLNGAFMFLSDLAKYIKIPAEISFIKVSSYQGISSTGEVKDLIGLDAKLQGRKVIVVEDIIDTGLSMTHLLKKLKINQPSQISVVTLLFKPEALKHQLKIDYIGFEIPNKFVVGYGLDYDGFGRNLPAIYQLK
ncbi:hypoxanthine phosphoribosyltransferase [Belliella buryatensis]|uniref:Hypoxanthine phosphoribosyltransferase n=1 Tax=Belliella buryatensis TaxID=1500549 RepID=A0A239B5K8_9BACT|nr:hypoxanthine phosphoribosyltransferase [Belliella buryatensis]SNS02508.1 hypoxanthine phosphoribosyltransferase [Belliella buryatensis]